ncbi:MAG: hypothetical protein DRP89_04630 [Candidatus Neomarinimicrobiota bacterium]|nr:MAG: hypothetical protein DRP89_04630 [Candidatus Neomarinimicrobiota bacterium]
MMRNYRYQIFILFFLLSFFSALFSEVPDAEYIEIVKEYKLQSDGSVTFSYNHKLRLNSYFAINRHYGETFIIYNPDYQTLEVKNSETTMKDGKKVQSPLNAFNEVLPRFAADAPSFNHFREMVVTHVGLERGCTVDLSYVLKTDKEFMPGLMGEEIFADYSPIHKITVRVIIPDTENLNYELFNSDIEPKIEIRDNSKIYTWFLKELQGIPVEKDQPEWGEFAPRLIFSTVESWDTIFNYLNSFICDSLELSASTHRIVDKQLEDALDPQSKMLRLQRLVADEMGYVNCKPWVYGFKAKSAESVFMENVGSGWEKAILLKALLEYSGAKAYPALVSRYKEFGLEVPSLYQFDNFVVICLYPNMQKIYLSPTRHQEGDLMPSISNKTLLNIRKAKKKFSRIRDYKSKENYQQMFLKLELDDSLMIRGEGNFTFGGCFNKAFKFGSDNNSAKSEIESSIATSNLNIGRMEVNRLDNNKSEFYVEFSSTECLEVSNGYIKWKIPEFIRGFNSSNFSATQTERVTPISLQSAFIESYVVLMKIPKSLELITPYFNRRLKNNVGEVAISIEKEGHNTLILKRSLILKKSEIAPSEYNCLKKLISVWQEPKFQNLVFNK